MSTWLDIPEFPRYAVSPTGVVRNLKTGRDLKPMDNGKGYMQVRLYSDGRYQSKSVKLLVAQGWEERNRRSTVPEEDLYGIDIW